jgi:hypothetical protein
VDLSGDRSPGARGGLVTALLWVFLALALSAAARAGDPPEKRRIVVFGDSQGQGIAVGLARVLLEDSRFKVINRTHPGASFAHDEAEWIVPIRRFLKTEQADIAVVMFGGNDRIDIKNAGRYLRFKTDAWREEYVSRVDTVMKALSDAGLEVVWCGNPIARSETYSSDMDYINRIFAGQAERFGIEFLPLWTVVADDGKYAAYGKDLDGLTRRLRTDDGIHFTTAGYELIAEKIVGLIPAAPPDAK